MAMLLTGPGAAPRRLRVLLHCLDLALAVALVLGVAIDPLVFAHAAAVVLVVQAFTLGRTGAALRLLLALTVTAAASARADVPLEALAVQLPFVYGVAALVIVLAETLRRSRNAFERRALYDSLTDLPNRTLFNQRVEQALRDAHQGGALLLLDLDRFKDVNDTFGHEVGDLLLEEVAVRLAAAVRAEDTVARLGGDEFAVLVHADERLARSLAERLQASLTAPFILGGQALNVGASVGIARFPADGRDAATLLRRADIAMYAAKRSAGSVETYRVDQEDEGGRRLVLMAELGEAIEGGQLSLAFQPQVDARTGAVLGAEALLRWRHPQRGDVPPGEFIPVVERTGVIRWLSRWVVDAALAQARAWGDRGHDLPVSVNVSARDLADPGLAAEIAELLGRHGVPAQQLTIEVTESGLVADERRAVETVAQLRALGLRVSIDDFGTGYSSIAYLNRLGAHEVKIDRSFVQGGRDPSCEAIVRASVELGHALGLEIVAEGVEDAPTGEWLRAIGCDRLQGYFIARPLTAEAFESWLAARRPRAVA